MIVINVCDNLILNIFRYIFFTFALSPFQVNSIHPYRQLYVHALINNEKTATATVLPALALVPLIIRNSVLVLLITVYCCVLQKFSLGPIQLQTAKDPQYKDFPGYILSILYGQIKYYQCDSKYSVSHLHIIYMSAIIFCKYNDKLCKRYTWCMQCQTRLLCSLYHNQKCCCILLLQSTYMELDIFSMYHRFACMQSLCSKSCA